MMLMCKAKPEIDRERETVREMGRYRERDKKRDTKRVISQFEVYIDGRLNRRAPAKHLIM